MKTIYLIFALGAATLLTSCGGNESTEKKESAETTTEEKADPNALATSYCECLSNSANTDSCSQLTVNYAIKLATDQQALNIYNTKTEECLNAKLEADMNKAVEGLEELEKKATAE